MLSKVTFGLGVAPACVIAAVFPAASVRAIEKGMPPCPSASCIAIVAVQLGLAQVTAAPRPAI